MPPWVWQSPVGPRRVRQLPIALAIAVTAFLTAAAVGADRLPFGVGYVTPLALTIGSGLLAPLWLLLSTLVGLIQRALASALDSLVGQIAVTVALGLVMAGVAWVFVRGAAVARRRINLTLDGPAEALWETIGRCGEPPSDPSRLFALIGIILAFLPWVLIPTGVLISWVTSLF